MNTRKPIKILRTAISASVLAACMGLSPSATASDPFLAQITMFGGNFAPRDWALCDGQLLQIASNTAVFSLLGTTFGGDGRTTFGLPDLRGRVAIHPGRGPGLADRRLGQTGGAETHTLTAAQMPAHTHGLRASDTRGNSSDPTGHVNAVKSRTNIYSDAAPNVSMSSQAVANTGGGQAHNNMQPWLGINHIIALRGVFPSRN